MKPKDKEPGACCEEPTTSEEAMSEPNAACCASSKGTQETTDASVKTPSATGTRTDKRRLDIDFLYLDLSVCTRCRGTESSLEAAIAEVAQILEATSVQVVVNKIHVKSEEQAATLGLLVSPTIRVNGRDIQMNFRESRCESCADLCDCKVGVSCREWEYQGQWHTVPPKGLIIEAILKVVYGSVGEQQEVTQQARAVPDNLKRFFASVREDA
ncbi:MAG: DUF2703 domain-containing protein [Acidiferrobacterales bacterium]